MFSATLLLLTTNAIILSSKPYQSDASTFRPVKFQNGTIVCAGDAPTYTMTFEDINSIFPGDLTQTIPLVQCGFYCTSRTPPVECIGFNYRPQSGLCEVFSRASAILLSLLPCIYYEEVSVIYNYGSCKQLHARDPSAVSGEYSMKITGIQTPVKAYCDMTTNGGGYTFINPLNLAVMTEDELLARYTERQSVVLRTIMVDMSQRIGLLEQLPEFINYPLKLGLNENNGYIPPTNLQTLGFNYLYIGFISAAVSTKYQTQGLIVNGQQVTFTNCNGTPSSYFSLFPNVNCLTPITNYGDGGIFRRLNQVMNTSALHLPIHYFMFVETAWGACGAYAQAGEDGSNEGMFGAAVGFR